MLEKFNNCNSFVILTHERPDGDAIASSLAMYWYLVKAKENSSEVTNIDIIIPEFSEKFSFLPGFDQIKTEPAKYYDVLIILDVSESHRIKGYDRVSSCCSTTICIDHHEGFSLEDCQYSYIDSSAPSTTAILYKLFGNLSKEFLECVLTGILSDTQNLTFNTDATTMEIVKELETFGLDINRFKNLVAQKDPRTLQLADFALKRSTTTSYYDTIIFSSFISQKDLLKEEKTLASVDHKQIIKCLQERKKNGCSYFGHRK